MCQLFIFFCCELGVMIHYAVIFVTEFADMSWEEFSKGRLGAAQHCSATKKGSHKLTDVVVPLTVYTLYTSISHVCL